MTPLIPFETIDLMVPQEMAYVVITPNDNVVILKNAQQRSISASEGLPGNPERAAATGQATAHHRTTGAAAQAAAPDQ